MRAHSSARLRLQGPYHEQRPAVQKGRLAGDVPPKTDPGPECRAGLPRPANATATTPAPGTAELCCTRHHRLRDADPDIGQLFEGIVTLL